MREIGVNEGPPESLRKSLKDLMTREAVIEFLAAMLAVDRQKNRRWQQWDEEKWAGHFVAWHVDLYVERAQAEAVAQVLAQASADIANAAHPMSAEECRVYLRNLGYAISALHGVEAQIPALVEADFVPETQT